MSDKESFIGCWYAVTIESNEYMFLNKQISCVICDRTEFYLKIYIHASCRTVYSKIKLYKDPLCPSCLSHLKTIDSSLNIDFDNTFICSDCFKQLFKIHIYGVKVSRNIQVLVTKIPQS